MSHGEQGGILNTFDANINIESLYEAFLPEKCASLKNKPKLFFIQRTISLGRTRREHSQPERELTVPPFQEDAIRAAFGFRSMSRAGSQYDTAGTSSTSSECQTGKINAAILVVRIVSAILYEARY
ncbi:unnamed protein product, partial [Darwinula stevensoni]